MKHSQISFQFQNTKCKFELEETLEVPLSDREREYSDVQTAGVEEGVCCDKVKASKIPGINVKQFLMGLINNTKSSVLAVRTLLKEKCETPCKMLPYFGN